ncbi:MAG: hypothetical protein E6772_17975 [Dysgonomonas sp.]|nr:hypothetical protein [Dysgonomonas sp.]
MKYVRRESYAQYIIKRKSHIVIEKVFFALYNRIQMSNDMDENLKKELEELLEMAKPHLRDIVGYFNQKS